MKSNKSVRRPSEEVEAMTIIINIQAMQEKIQGKRFEYEQFNGNTLEELRELQEWLIPEYNKAVAKQS